MEPAARARSPDMFRFAFFTCALTLLLSASRAWSQTLWEGAKFGMTPAQVSIAHPSARPAGSEPQTLASGAREELRIEDYEYLGKKYQVSFYFLDGKLNQVMASLDKNRYSPDEMGSTFDEVFDAFVAKFGKEQERRGVSEQNLRSRSATWQVDERRITVINMQAGGFSLLNLVFQHKDAKPAQGK